MVHPVNRRSRVDMGEVNSSELPRWFFVVCLFCYMFDLEVELIFVKGTKVDALP